jgi:hypothetical protein
MRLFKASPVTAPSFICYIIAEEEYRTGRLVVNALKGSRDRYSSYMAFMPGIYQKSICIVSL